MYSATGTVGPLVLVEMDDDLDVVFLSGAEDQLPNAASASQVTLDVGQSTAMREWQSRFGGLLSHCDDVRDARVGE